MKVMLINPNYSWLGGRSWISPPYGLVILKSQLMPYHDTILYDPNYSNDSKEAFTLLLLREAPDIILVSSISTDKIEEVVCTTRLCREVLPKSKLVVGGIIPTVIPEVVDRYIDADYFFGGEADTSILDIVNGKMPSGLYTSIDDYKGNTIVDDLDSILPINYDNIICSNGPVTLSDYGNIVNKYATGMIPRQFPSAIVVTSRGCFADCNFCSASVVSGRKVRCRSTGNVISELDMLYGKGIREFIFLDDHLLHKRNRAEAIMHHIKNYGNATWKSVNLALWAMDDNLMLHMRDTGCNYITLSIESGVQRVLDEVIQKPVKIDKANSIVKSARSMGFDIVVNFVIGSPGETYNEILQTIEYAANLDVDMVNFHLATPLPKTRLEKECIELGIIDGALWSTGMGYTRGTISTQEFSADKVSELRYKEWDRINFSSDTRKKNIARLCGITMEELEGWRVRTREQEGATTAAISGG